MGVFTLTGVAREDGGSTLRRGNQVTMGMKPPNLCLEWSAVYTVSTPPL